MAKATFAAGCFWGVEALFWKTDGITSTCVGYTGGTTESPTYADVCSRATGHAEAVEVEYDPMQVAYEDLLNIFWDNHDPTQHHRQGPDIGSQYRSAVFYHDDEQRNLAVASKIMLERGGTLKNSIVTEIVPAAKFWPAEEYHQRYLEKNGSAVCSLQPGTTGS